MLDTKTKKQIQDSAEYKGMNMYKACSIAEGFCGYEPTTEQLQAAWQWLYDQQAYLTLQDWYGRTMRDLIEQGLIYS